ncbi:MULTISPECIES: hypothetical protein [Sphingobacterium]|uniref:Uncharacterized protein n=1 Tax=Sphingobacterium zeae TaxID=1776859 RepID=A0ABU0U6S9_9SPHI|nr:MULTISPECIES: hypothetical protein [Sphingobacterium]MDQ1150662.1 hypothetical protein [Sphingobacterium zeae]
MKKTRKFALVASTLMVGGVMLFSCQNSKNNTSGGAGQSDNIAPTDADETRYNLSEQQKMSMQKDTSLADTLRKDSISGK